MQRRTFLLKTLYSVMAIGLARRAHAQITDHSAHGAMAHHESNEEAIQSASSQSLDLRRLRSGEALLAPLPLVINKTLTPMRHEVQLHVQPASIMYTRDQVSTQMWRYVGDTSGNMLDVLEGDTLKITVHNHLSEPTTVHWHGLPVPADQDGHPKDAIAPRGTRVYEFTLPQGSAGTYWYHPHPHQRTSAQVAMGLAAPIVVRSPRDPLQTAGITEHVLMFTSLQLDAQAQISAHSMDEMMNGREGNVLLVNDQYQPMLMVQPNSTHRLRLINATSARYLRLSLGGLPMTPVGSDGGLLEKSLPIQTEILLAPSERMEVCVTFPDGMVELQALPYDKGWMDMGMSGMKPTAQTVDVMMIHTQGAKAQSANLPQRLRPIEALPAATVVRQMVLTEHMQMSMDHGQHSMVMDFMINGQKHDVNRIDFVAKQGQVEQWDIINQTDMDHVFHIHGDHFQVVSVEEKGKVTPATHLGWKDSVNTRAGQTVRIKIRQNQKGIRMYHCHVLEHEDLGMMGQYDVQ